MRKCQHTVLRNKNERLWRSLAKVPLSFGMSFLLRGVNTGCPSHPSLSPVLLMCHARSYNFRKCHLPQQAVNDPDLGTIMVPYPQKSSAWLSYNTAIEEKLRCQRTCQHMGFLRKVVGCPSEVSLSLLVFGNVR